MFVEMKVTVRWLLIMVVTSFNQKVKVATLQITALS